MEADIDPEVKRVFIVGSCSYRERLQVLFAPDSKDIPMSLPYVNPRHIEWAPKRVTTLSFVIPEDRIQKTHHFDRMRIPATVFLYVFKGSLEQFWNTDYERMKTWLGESNQKAPFIVLVELLARNDDRRAHMLEREIELYLGFQSGEFLYFPTDDEDDRTYLWAQVAKQTHLQQQAHWTRTKE